MIEPMTLQHDSSPIDASPLARHRTRQVLVGKVKIGGEAPVVVQSMTNTDTADVLGTAMQVAELARAGSEIVRITVNNEAAAAAVPKIRDRLLALNWPLPAAVAARASVTAGAAPAATGAGNAAAVSTAGAAAASPADVVSTAASVAASGAAVADSPSAATVPDGT